MAGWTIFSKKNERKETDPAADANGEERREEEATPVTATETLAESTPTEETVPEAKPESAASGTETEDNTPETGNQEEDKSLENIVDRMADAIQQELYKTVAEKVKEALSPLQQNFHALGKALETLNRNQQELYKMQQGIRDKVQEGNTRIEEVVEAQEATIQKQHNSLLKFQEDVIYKIQKNLIMELIGIADNIRMIIENKENDPDGVYAGHYYLNAKCTTRPGIVDKNMVPIMDEEDVYSGMWAVVSVTFFGYDTNGKKGVACGLNNVMKYKDGERLGGRVSADRDFADLDMDDEDDDL